MTGSKLATAKIPAHKGNFTVGRNGKKIKKVTVHHMAACWTAKRCGELFQKEGRKASSHYGIGMDGEIMQYVSEKDTAWCDGDWNSNLTSVTIECANEKTGSPWPVSEATLTSLAALLCDISLRHSLGFYKKGENLTWHRMYSATCCPGEFLLEKMDTLVKKANDLIRKALAEKGEVFAEAEKEEIKAKYQVYHGTWLPEVSGYDVKDAEYGYAGVLGRPISGVSASLSRGNLYYQVHLKGQKWLPEVKNRLDYAGILSRPIDGVMFRAEGVKVYYRVHTAEDGWLPEVSGYDRQDAEYGYAGVLGHCIDGIMLRAEPME